MICTSTSKCFKFDLHIIFLTASPNSSIGIIHIVNSCIWHSYICREQKWSVTSHTDSLEPPQKNQQHLTQLNPENDQLHLIQIHWNPKKSTASYTAEPKKWPVTSCTATMEPPKNQQHLSTYTAEPKKMASYISYRYTGTQEMISCIENRIETIY